MAEGSYRDSALYVSSLDSARFSWAGREYLGRIALREGLGEDLRALELEPAAYGETLYDAVFPAGSELREGLREAIVAAEQERSRLRFLLHLAPDLPDWVHGLFWELLVDGHRHLALARSPDTAFCRYLGVRRAPGTPATLRPRLLCVISAPSDVARFQMAEIRRHEVVERLRAPFGMLAEAVDVTVLEPPATLGRLRARLMADGGFHLLHFFGHGQVTEGASALLMEDDEGRAKPVPEELLAEVFLGVRELRLVTLIACHGGAPSSGDPFSGLAGRLVQRGLPAVIAMRRAVSVEDAHLFTNHLYGHLVQTGRADAAVNEARQQLYLADPKGIAWSSPVLYSRLTDGRLWLPQHAAKDPGPAGGPATPKAPRVRFSWRKLRRPLPWVPAALAVALLALAVWPAPSAEAKLDLWVSRLSFQLAGSASVVDRLHLREIAATQLASLRLPPLPAAAPPPQAGTGMAGFLLAARPEEGSATEITLDVPPLPADTRVALDHLGWEGADAPEAYRLSFDGSSEQVRVTLRGSAFLKPLDAPAILLRFPHPESLVLHPQSRSLDLDVALSRFAGDEIAREIPIGGLTLLRIVERHGAGSSAVREEPTLLGGTIELPATGARHHLKRGEALRLAGVDGALLGLRLGEDGLRVAFQGRLCELERTAPRLRPESLMPSVLDLWLAGPAQRAVLAGSGGLAVLVLLASVLKVRIRDKEIS